MTVEHKEADSGLSCLSLPLCKGSAHPYPPKFLSIASKLVKNTIHPNILDLGGGDRCIKVSGFVNLDTFKYPQKVNIVGDAHHLPFRSSTFDFILCQAVLEHCRKPWIVTKEVHRICKPGGLVYVDNAFMQPYHPRPRHFFNTTKEGLEILLEGFTRIDSGVNEYQMPSFTVAWVLSEYVLSFFKKGAFLDRESFRTSVGPRMGGVRLLLLWVLYNLLLSFLRRLDFLIKPDNVENIACGVFFFGRKPIT